MFEKLTISNKINILLVLTITVMAVSILIAASLVVRSSGNRQATKDVGVCADVVQDRIERTKGKLQEVAALVAANPEIAGALESGDAAFVKIRNYLDWYEFVFFVLLDYQYSKICLQSFREIFIAQNHICLAYYFSRTSLKH